MNDYVDNSKGLIDAREQILDKIEKVNALSCKLELAQLIEQAQGVETAIEDAIAHKAKIGESLKARMLERYKGAGGAKDVEGDYMFNDQELVAKQNKYNDEIVRANLKLKTIERLISNHDTKLGDLKATKMDLDKKVKQLTQQIEQIEEKEAEMQKSNLEESKLNNEYFKIKASVSIPSRFCAYSKLHQFTF